MADDVSPGELYRRQIDHEQRTDRIHAALDGRVTDLAKDMVPLRMWQQTEQERDKEILRLEQEHDSDMAQVRGELKELRDRPQMTLGRWAVVATAVIALLALVIQAYGTLKGAK
ncbi:hypothetical protein ACWGCW_01135 [Streptomyces sp. NPDC054933]